MDFRTHLQQQLPEKDPAYWSLRQFADAYLNEAYGEGHLLFACYAAFPILLSPELLYKIWLNFRQYDRTSVPPAEIQWEAVSDLLTSGLVEEAGPEVFEMDSRVRDLLISYLEQRPEGMDTLTQLAEFMLYYSTNTLFSRPVFPENILEAQRWNALAFLRPNEAIRELKEQLRGAVGRQDQLEQARLGKILERLDQRMNQMPAEAFGHPARAFRALLTYNRGMRAFFHGKIGEAVRSLGGLPHYRLTTEAGANTAKGQALPLPRIIFEQLRPEEPAEPTAAAAPGDIYALFIGIDKYSTISPLSGAVRDATELAGWLINLVDEDRLHVTLLRDAEATQAATMDHLRRMLRAAQSNDVVLFCFGGHGLNRGQGSERNALLFYDYSGERLDQEIFYDTDFRKLVEAEATHDPAIALFLDTHAGSDRWLDIQRDHHVVLAACAEEETSFETEGRGVFSLAIQQILEGTSGRITYRRLLREVRRRIGDRFRQFPQLLTTPTGADRLLLAADHHPLPRLLELLRDAGYYDGPIDPGAAEAAQTALQRFQSEWGLQPEDDPMESLERKLLAEQGETLQVLIIGGYQHEEVDGALERLFQELPYPTQADYYRLDIPLAKAAQKAPSKIQSNPKEKGISKTDRAQIIVLLVDDYFLRIEESAALLKRIRQRRQTDYLPVVPLLLEDCNWSSHPVADLPEMALYRGKGRFTAPDWAPNEGMRWLRDTLDPIGRFLRAPGEQDYLTLCRRFRDDMPFDEMENLRQDLQKAAAGLTSLAFLVNALNPDTPQWRIFGAACALLEQPDTAYADPVVDYLEGIQDDGPLHNVRLNVVYQLVAALERMAEADNRQPSPSIVPPTREGAIATLFSLNRQPRVFRDRTKAGRGSISFKIFQTILRLSEPLPGSTTDYFFRGGQVAIPLEFGILSLEDLGVTLPPQRVITLLVLCEEFDGEMSVRAMDELGRRLKKHMARLETVDWIVPRLRSGLSQGYVFGIAYAVQEKPDGHWLPVLTEYLRDIARLPNLGDLRLRVLYRLLMALEKLVEADTGIEARSPLIDILEEIAGSERARRDTEETGGKGIGGRIDQLIRKLRPPVAEASLSPDHLRDALYRLPFREQLEAAAQEVDTGARIIPIIAAVPPAAGPGLLRDLLCRQFHLPPDRMVRIPLSEVANYGWSEHLLMRGILDGLGLGSGVPSFDFDAFLEALAQQDRYHEVVISLEDPGEIPEHLQVDFLREWLAFCDRLARKLGERTGASGLRKVWFIVLVEQLPSHFSAEEFGGWISPVLLPEVRPTPAEELLAWAEREKLAPLRRLVQERLLPEYQPLYAIALIKRICQELGQVEEVYDTDFGDYEVDEEDDLVQIV